MRRRKKLLVFVVFSYQKIKVSTLLNHHGIHWTILGSIAKSRDFTQHVIPLVNIWVNWIQTKKPNSNNGIHQSTNKLTGQPTKSSTSGIHHIVCAQLSRLHALKACLNTWRSCRKRWFTNGNAESLLSRGKRLQFVSINFILQVPSISSISCLLGMHVLSLSLCLWKCGGHSVVSDTKETQNKWILILLKKCTTWHAWNLQNDRILPISLVTCIGFIPSTVCCSTI